jgi:hypothetical protein
MTAENQANQPRITALPPGKVCDVLRRAGARHVSPESIQADIEAGAPVNDDGTVNLIEYAAWLVGRMADGD